MRRAPGSADGFDQQVSHIAALGEPIRRALYRFVIAERDPVGRDEAASAVGVAHHVAKFHLDRLEADGLLDTEYSRPAGRRGPGAGRPAKRYRRSTREVSVSLPARRYDLAGRIMAQAIATAAEAGIPIADALRDTATAEGRRLAERSRPALGPDPGPAASARAVSVVLADCGYEPRAEGDAVTLVNCPFHALAQEHRNAGLRHESGTDQRSAGR